MIYDDISRCNVEHDSLINSAKDKGYDVLILDGPLSSHFIQKAEQDFGVSFARVDADTLDNIIPKEEEIPSKLSKEEEEKIKPIFENISEKENMPVDKHNMSVSDDLLLKHTVLNKENIGKTNT